MHSVALEVKEYILKNKLISPCNTVICGFSGGADSMCMLELLYELSFDMGFKVVAVHINHGLRGINADTDEIVCKTFCEQKNIEFFSKKVDIKRLAKDSGCGEEEMGRNVRYAFFTEIAKKYPDALIATAHTKNDLAETVLHRVIRGSSVKGLVGIRPKRDNIIRPILCLTRRQVEKFCDDKMLEFVTDKTNFDTVYTRNKIRLDIIPRLKDINIAVVDSLATLSQISADDSDFIEKIADAEYKKIVTCGKQTARAEISDILGLDNAIKTRIIIKMAHSLDIKPEYKHVRTIYDMCAEGKTGKVCYIPGGYARISYGSLEISKQKPVTQDGFFINAVSGETVLAGDYEVCVVVADSEFCKTAEIVVRSRKDGDKITVNSMTKKLKKVFIDLKIPRNKRMDIPIVEVNKEIYCVGNILQSDSLKNSKDKIRVSVKLKQHINTEETYYE